MDKNAGGTSRRMDMEFVVGSVLQTGLVLSLGFILIGFLWRYWRTGHFQFDYQIPPVNLLGFWREDFKMLFRGLLRPRLLVNFGIALLLITPYMRVFVSVLYFSLIKKNIKYTMITLFVLAALTYNLFFNMGG